MDGALWPHTAAAASVAAAAGAQAQPPSARWDLRGEQLRPMLLPAFPRAASPAPLLALPWLTCTAAGAAALMLPQACPSMRGGGWK